MMTQAVLPNFQQLAHHMTAAAHQVSSIPNLPNDGQLHNQLQRIGADLQELTGQQGRITEQLGHLEHTVNNIATRIQVK